MLCVYHLYYLVKDRNLSTNINSLFTSTRTPSCHLANNCREMHNMLFHLLSKAVLQCVAVGCGVWGGVGWVWGRMGWGWGGVGWVCALAE